MVKLLELCRKSYGHFTSFIYLDIKINVESHVISYLSFNNEKKEEKNAIKRKTIVENILKCRSIKW